MANYSSTHTGSEFDTGIAKALNIPDAISSITSSVYNAAVTDEILDCNCTNGNIIVNLPSAIGVTGKEMIIRKSDETAHTLTVNGYLTQTINGSTNKVMNAQYDFIYIKSNGSNWLQLSSTSASVEALLAAHTGAADPHTQYVMDADLSGQIVYVQSSEPTAATENDLWIMTSDYSRYDTAEYTTDTVLSDSDSEVIFCNSPSNTTVIITLHAATQPGIIKKIYNTGSGTVRVSGSLRGSAGNLDLSANQSAELITDGTTWRY